MFVEKLNYPIREARTVGSHLKRNRPRLLPRAALAIRDGASPTWTGPVTWDSLPPTDTWVHFALVRSGSTPFTRLYFDGAFITGAEDDSDYFTSAPVFTLGARHSKDQGWWHGYVAEFRVSSVARYAAADGDFAPLVAPRSLDPPVHVRTALFFRVTQRRAYMRW